MGTTTELLTIICLCAVIIIIEIIMAFWKPDYMEKYRKSPIPLAGLLLLLALFGYRLFSGYAIQKVAPVTGIIYLILVAYFVSGVYKYFKSRKRREN